MPRYTQEQIDAAIQAYKDHPVGQDAQPHTLERQYLNALMYLTNDSGAWTADEDRTGTGTRRMNMPWRFTAVFPEHTQDLTFPVLTSRKIWWRGALAEAIWMWQGKTELDSLDRILPGAGEKFWGQWAFLSTVMDTKHIGRAYGFQFGQKLAPTLELLKRDPTTRRACFSLWEQSDLQYMALPPCHGCFIQFRALPSPNGRRRLYLDMTQRSGDICVGVPSNIIAYYTLLRVAAAWLNFDLGGLTITVNDLHLYKDHIPQAEAQVKKGWATTPPSLTFSPGCDIGLDGMWGWRALSAKDALATLQLSWFQLDGVYEHAGDLKFNVAQ